jgi:hypothetical protein
LPSGQEIAALALPVPVVGGVATLHEGDARFGNPEQFIAKLLQETGLPKSIYQSIHHAVDETARAGNAAS